MAACSPQNNNEISKRVADIQQNNIQDKRLQYWNVDIASVYGKTTLSGATASENAYNDLKEYSKKQNIEFSVDLLPIKKFKGIQWGIVTLSVCNIRGFGRHSAELVTQAIMGTPVKVYNNVDGWYLIQTPDRYFGWVDNTAIALKTNSELLQWKAMKKVLYKNQNGFTYEKADAGSAVECDLVLANLLSVTESVNGFYKILLADGREAFVRQDECISLDIWKKKSVDAGNVLSTAFNFKGVPYLWGGTSAKMVDCSGFTKSIYYLYGIILQRDASQQTLYGELVNTENGYGNLLAGDLVFFGKKATADKKERVTHVGLCIGNQQFIHASGKVRINSLNRNHENYTEYYETAFVRARRIVGNIDGIGIEWVVNNKFYKEILPE